MVSADRSQLGVLRAFDAGADDVVGRPFAYLELRARLEGVPLILAHPSARVWC